MRFIAVLQSMLLVSGFQGSRQVWPQSAYVSAEELLAKTEHKSKIAAGVRNWRSLRRRRPSDRASDRRVIHTRDESPRWPPGGRKWRPECNLLACGAHRRADRWDRSAMFSFADRHGQRTICEGSTVTPGPG